MSEFGKRLTRLEGEVARARKDAAAARVLAGGADRDVAAMQMELRAHTKSLNALRETQVEQGQLLTEHSARLARLEQLLDDCFRELRGGFRKLDGGMREGFARLGVGQARITALLTAHLDKPGADR
ncbi:hypothetical protein [Actinophytocola sp.]|uniref:hypothetical protein n=1 Tax=Actinophytocola sp. TaxID=1872138 RepID=UPI002ED77710